MDSELGQVIGRDVLKELLGDGPSFAEMERALEEFRALDAELGERVALTAEEQVHMHALAKRMQPAIQALVAALAAQKQV